MFTQILVMLACLLLNTFPAWAQKQLVDRVVAVVNDEAITQSEMDVYLRPLYEELRQQYGGEELAKQLDEVRLKLLNQMIEDRLVFQDAKTRGITVDESEIDEVVEETKKRFSSDTEFENMLIGQGYNLNELRESFHRQIAVRKLQDMQIRSQVVVSPQEIEDYYKNHQSEFAEEEAVKVRSVSIRKNEDAVKKGIIDENAKKEIETIEKRIRGGESFEKLAQEFSEDANAKQGGMVGWVKRGAMLPAIDKNLFELQVGGISPVLETSVGFHLFKVEEKRTSRIPPLDEVREKIRRILFQQEAQARFKEWMEQLKNRAYISIR